MISYELAKRLKEAGFPQRTNALISGTTAESLDLRSVTHKGGGYHVTYDSSTNESPEQLRAKPVGEWNGKWRASIYMSETYLTSDEGREFTIYLPTLSELIEWCGDKFGGLNAHGGLGQWDREKQGEWHAYGDKVLNATLHTYGFTPEVAVAELGIALHTK